MSHKLISTGQTDSKSRNRLFSVFNCPPLTYGGYCRYNSDSKNSNDCCICSKVKSCAYSTDNS